MLSHHEVSARQTLLFRLALLLYFSLLFGFQFSGEIYLNPNQRGELIRVIRSCVNIFLIFFYALVTIYPYA